jgi:hypothetical protein
MTVSQLLLNAKRLELKMRQLQIKKKHTNDFTKAFKLTSDIHKLNNMRDKLLKKYYTNTINPTIGYKLYSKAV